MDKSIDGLAKRKSVSFSEGAVVVDSHGQITATTHSEKTTADRHSNTTSLTSPLDDIRTNTTDKHTEDAATKTEASDAAVDEVTQLMASLTHKKKKKSKQTVNDATSEIPSTSAVDDAETDLNATVSGSTAIEEDGFDATALRKRKKKKKAIAATDFEAKLAKAGAVGPDGSDASSKLTAEAKAAALAEQSGDFEKGTGIWEHNCTTPISYALLLNRFFTLLHSHHPDLSTFGSKSYKIPPPQCLREGNKKTIFANVAEICKRMKRSDEHVIQFLFAELGTNGSVDGNRRLVIKGRFQQKQIEIILRRYIVEYVTCKTCRSPDTDLVKGENRLSFICCNSCGSRRSVSAIKTGFSAQVGKRKRPN